MAYALRASDTEGGPKYARKCEGYAQTTESRCCGGKFCQAKNCCSNLYAWFPIDKIGCAQGKTCPGFTLLHDGACWKLTGLGPLTELEIVATFPGQLVNHPSEPLDCLDDCDDPLCPPCPDDCCLVVGRDPERCLADCRFINQPCICGQEWTVTVSLHAIFWNRQCLVDGIEGCQRFELTFAGTVSWRYTKPDEFSFCELVMTACSGSMHETLTWEGVTSCLGSPESYDQTFNMANPGPLGGMYGCGQNPITLARLIAGWSRFGVCGILFFLGDTCDNESECLPCSRECHVPCENQTGKPGFHHIRSGVNTCTNKEMHVHEWFECDLGCFKSDECIADLAATVITNVGCDGPIDGVDTGTPDAGDIPVGGTF